MPNCQYWYWIQNIKFEIPFEIKNVTLFWVENDYPYPPTTRLGVQPSVFIIYGFSLYIVKTFVHIKYTDWQSI